MLSEMWSAITPKDILIPTLTALGGWLAASRMSRSNEKLDEKRRDDAIQERVHDAKVARDEDLTKRFTLLMNSYEKKIDELTAEIQELRVRVEACEQKWRMRDAAATAAA